MQVTRGRLFCLGRNKFDSGSAGINTTFDRYLTIVRNTRGVMLSSEDRNCVQNVSPGIIFFLF